MADRLTKVMTVNYPSRMRQIPTACGVVHSYLSGGTSEVTALGESELFGDCPHFVFSGSSSEIPTRPLIPTSICSVATDDRLSARMTISV